MSLRDFWTSVRAAARRFAPLTTVDAPKLDAGMIEEILRADTLWLSPRAVRGFQEADFHFLPQPEREQLARLVKTFLEVASEVTRAKPATDDQVHRALPLFRDIVGLLEFDRYGDAEAYQLGKQIEQQIAPHRPAELAELRFNTGLDNTGDPGVWIWAFLSDDEDATVLARAKAVRPLLDEASRAVAPDLFPYINFRMLSEQSIPTEVEAL